VPIVERNRVALTPAAGVMKRRLAAEPLLVDPDPDALVATAQDAEVVAVGLTERWRREGLGRSRTALAARDSGTTVLVRRGVRPGGLAPRGSDTRFTWTLASLP